jgi:FtsH-binding integral membrane protein
LNPAVVKDSVHELGGVQRFLGWLVLVLLLPVFTISFIRAMVRKESNRANAFTLAIYTGVDALLAFLLLGASFASWLAVLLFLVVVGVAFAYNVFIMSFALKLEQ